ncbi:hypothetical protein LZZ90_03300 [Flavobacterium sp. SM15]|uniref:hypothetical protein n=1 Tax=Flavobacterium sp. SM15 TaxID=2908005 RepID=UPI001EDC022B|nr:hypothetical protein [Flavobacterium sp. SM15]MCG2610531.1 hypothetical protein [Flavobacterium sp. SM15]
MKYLILMVLASFLISCNSDKNKQQQFYKATRNENSAVLSLKIDNDQFYGRYKVRYADGIIDSGNVRGVIIGDTLRGRFKYISYGGNQEVKPFLLLKRGDTLRLGSGAVYKYMKIPYYTPGSIEFRTSDFQFLPINETDFKDSDSKMK